MSSAPQSIQGTVYSGPAIETRHRGPAPSAAQGHASNQTVFDPSTHISRSRDNNSLARSSMRQATTRKVQSASIRFFIVSALSVIEYFAYRDTNHNTAAAALVTAVVFGVIGLFAMRASRTAFIVGMLLYGASTTLLLLSGCLVCMTAVAIPLLVHVAILYRLWSGYQSIGELNMI